MDKFTRSWIIENALDELQYWENGTTTIRGLHYRLVARGMTNTIKHYNRVKAAITVCRWDGSVSFEQFSDHERELLGRTDFERTDLQDEIERGEATVKYIMTRYYKNRWENQAVFPEVWIEKKALIGTFEPVCNSLDVGLFPCKGYPSLTHLHKAKKRYEDPIYEDKKVIIHYFGDYDASGENIPDTIVNNLERLGVENFELKRIMLMKDQVLEMDLPFAPTKEGDSRGKTWDGLGQVELDAVLPKTVSDMCREAILELLDDDLYSELMVQERKEEKKYKKKMRKLVSKL